MRRMLVYIADSAPMPWCGFDQFLEHLVYGSLLISAMHYFRALLSQLITRP